MKQHLEPGTLQDFLEGLLPPVEEEEAREHLASCTVCRTELADLERLRQDLGDLPVSAEPPRDLWPQIAWRMEGVRKDPVSGSDLVAGSDAGEALSSAEAGGVREARKRGHPSPGRRITLPAWQLLAASIALVVISGGSVWAVLSGRGGTFEPGTTADPGPAQLVAWEDAYSEYDDAVQDLEGVLEQGRDLLDDETIRVLEENLRSIDEAIQEASEALMRDPASPMLQRFLADHMRKKVDLLRQAAGAVYTIS